MKEINISKEISNIEDVIIKEGFLVNTTVGYSMYPMIRQGRDTVLIRPCNGRLKKYDVVLYKVNGNYILHRIIKVIPDSYIIRGDNCINKEYGITDADILGVLTEFYRDNKQIKVDDFVYKLYVRMWNFIFPIRYCYKRARGLASRIKRRIN